MKFYFIFFLIVSFVFVHDVRLTAQKESSYNQEQLQKFVTIYLESKRISVNHDSLVADILQKSNLNKEYYATVLRKSIEDDEKTALKQNEGLVKEISRIKNELKIIKENNTTTLCAKYALETEIYYSILEKYKSDPTFQNNLVIYFEEYINRQ